MTLKVTFVGARRYLTNQVGQVLALALGLHEGLQACADDSELNDKVRDETSGALIIANIASWVGDGASGSNHVVLVPVHVAVHPECRLMSPARMTMSRSGRGGSKGPNSRWRSLRMCRRFLG